MVNMQWLGLCCLLSSMMVGSATAQDNEIALEADFLEFIGEGKSVDGEYYDPLQMQDWVQKEVADSGQQQEDKDHE